MPDSQMKRTHLTFKGNRTFLRLLPFLLLAAWVLIAPLGVPSGVRGEPPESKKAERKRGTQDQDTKEDRRETRFTGTIKLRQKGGSLYYKFHVLRGKVVGGVTSYEGWSQARQNIVGGWYDGEHLVLMFQKSGWDIHDRWFSHVHQFRRSGDHSFKLVHTLYGFGKTMESDYGVYQPHVVVFIHEKSPEQIKRLISSTASEYAEKPKKSPWLELIRTVDIARDIRRGNWFKEDQTLRPGAPAYSTIELGEGMGLNYDLSLDLVTRGMRGARGGLYVAFPIGRDRAAHIALGRWEADKNDKVKASFGWIDGESGYVTDHKVVLRDWEAFEPQHMYIAVRAEDGRARIRCVINGKKIFEWEGRAERLSSPHYARAISRGIIIKTIRSDPTIKSLRVRAVDNDGPEAAEGPGPPSPAWSNKARKGGRAQRAESLLPGPLTRELLIENDWMIHSYRWAFSPRNDEIVFRADGTVVNDRAGFGGASWRLLDEHTLLISGEVKYQYNERMDVLFARGSNKSLHSYIYPAGDPPEVIAPARANEPRKRCRAQRAEALLPGPLTRELLIENDWRFLSSVWAIYPVGGKKIVFRADGTVAGYFGGASWQLVNKRTLLISGEVKFQYDKQMDVLSSGYSYIFPAGAPPEFMRSETQ